MKLLTDERALSLAIQLLQNDKNIQEQLIQNEDELKSELENKLSKEDLQNQIDSALTIKEF